MALVVESATTEGSADTYPSAASWVTDSGTLLIYGAAGKRLAEYPQGVWRRVKTDDAENPVEDSAAS